MPIFFFFRVRRVSLCLLVCVTRSSTPRALLNTAPSAANSVVRTLDESDELTFFRIRSKKHEIMVAPDKEYLLVVIQDPNL